MGGSGPDAVEDSGPDTPDDVGTDTPDDADENTPDAGPVCGDGEVDDTEECDDGNIESGDGCTPMCAIEPRCGDGVVNNVIAEECDGANEIDGDACSNLCETTEAFIRNPTESATVCGRGDCTTLGEIGGVRCYSVGD